MSIVIECVPVYINVFYSIDQFILMSLVVMVIGVH